MKLGLVALTFCAVAAGGATAFAQPSVTVDGVVLDGAVSPINSNVDNYYGIPYATAERWSPPKAHAKLTSPFNAKSYKTVDVCPQSDPVYVGTTLMSQSEDCLSLSVRVPASATPTSSLPVYVFIHGGEFQEGTGLQYFPDDMVAANDIVAVTINYRLGALGWMAQSAFAAAKANAFENAGDAGNYGLMDQQFALEWVKKNIAAFGGDPKKVTIGGQSAGGASVALNMASTTTAAGLFRAAIIESGGYDLHSIPTQSTYESLGNTFVNDVLAAEGTVSGIDCASLTSSSTPSKVRTCLNGALVSTILTAQQTAYGPFGISPDSGTLVVPNGLQQALSSGAFLKVPVLQGSNLNEGRYLEPGDVPFAALFSTVVAAGGPGNYDLSNANSFCGGTTCTYTQEINLLLTELGVPSSDNTAEFDSALATTDYPLTNFPDQYLSGAASSSDEGLAQIVTDNHFACNSLDSNTDLAGYVTVYAYELNDPFAPPSLADPALTKLPNDQYGYPTASEHGAELQFLFYFPYTPNLSTDEQELETTMQTYWANFVKNGNPAKGTSVPAWPSFGSKQEVLSLVPGPGKPTPITDFGTEHFCSIWQPIITGD
jgi:para-nitrobenzyl esterase